MTGRNCALWIHAEQVTQLCAEKLSAREAYASLQKARRVLSNSGANLNAPCARDSGHACELLPQLPQWNRILVDIHIQLRERNTPGELAVLCAEKYWSGPHWRLQRAVLLLHWLLTKHPCVAELQVDTWGLFGEHEEYFTLFCDGLRHCCRLRSLMLHGIRLPYWGADGECKFLGAMRNLLHLEQVTFAIADVSECGNMAVLCHLIASCAQLKRFEIQIFCGGPASHSYVVEALAGNVCLSDLRLDVRNLRESECNLFALALNKNKSLKSLRLLASRMEPALSMGAVARALEGMTTLATLELSYFNFTTSEAWTLVKSLARTKSVEQLALLACVPMFSHLNSVSCSGDNDKESPHIQPFLHVLEKVTSLRKLSFPLPSYPPQDQRAFFRALVANDAVEVRMPSLNHRYVSDFCRLVSETGTGTRMRFGSFPGHCWESTILSCDKFSLYEKGLLGEINSVFMQMSTLDILTTLTVSLREDIDTKSAMVLAEFLRRTQVLNNITMNFGAALDGELVLLEALSCNTSITALSVDGWGSSTDTAPLLADLVCANKRIVALSYHVSSVPSPPVLLRALAKHIGTNSTLLSVEAFPQKRDYKSWNRIQEIVARNHTFLVHAARCVTGCAIQKSGAEALELMPLNPMLVCKVQEMTSASEREARDAIRSRVTDLEDLDFFMSVVGVVKEKVVCEESKGGRASLDVLPSECWRIVRRYVRIADVL